MRYTPRQAFAWLEFGGAVQRADLATHLAHRTLAARGDAEALREQFKELGE